MTASTDAPSITKVIDRNLKHIEKVRAQEASVLTVHDRFADRVASFASSIYAVYVHLSIFGIWILTNTFTPFGSSVFDPFPFPLLGTLACLEAIFLSTFVLVNQTRMSRSADLRADLELQMTLLTEHELTRLIRATHRLANELGVDLKDDDLEEIKRDVRPDKIIERIERAAESAPKTI